MNEIECLDKGFVRLVDHMGDDSSIVQAARVSYGEGTKTVSEDSTLIRYLMRHEHTSPFEMVEFKFHCKMPIFVARQMIRHRTANVNEISGRYSEMPNDFYVPEDSVFTKQNPSNKQGGTNEVIKLETAKNIGDWVEWECLGDTPEEGASMYDTEETPWSWANEFKNEQELTRKNYERWLGTGVRRELARINLPLSQYTEWYWKMDLRNLLHFLKLRLDEHAQWEMRVYAEAIAELIKPIVPVTYQAFEDYILNSVTLSKTELDCLRNQIFSRVKPDETGLIDIMLSVRESVPNKREQDEFLDKLKKMLVI